MKFSSILLSASILTFLATCQSGIDQVLKVEKFNKNKPYALKIAKERSYYQADKISSRLNEMGVHSYIIQFSDTIEKTGNWFQIMCGAIENKDSATMLKSYLSQTFSINNTEIVKYNDYIEAKIDIDTTELNEHRRISSKVPDVPNHVLNLVKAFPDNNALYIRNLSIVNSPDEPEQMTGYSMIYKLKLDLPRGISRKDLLKATNCFAEVVYHDNLYGDKVTVELGMLRAVKKENQGDSVNIATETDKQKEIANLYADKILNTGDYPSEVKEEIEVDAVTKLKGYKVTISLWNKQKRTYLVLVDDSFKQLIISQSTDKTDEEIVEILQGIGQGDGLLNYGEFYNTFYTLPDKLIEHDRFIAFSLNRLEETYARNKSYSLWAKEMVGHWQASGYFRNSKKGNWSYSLFDLLTEKEQNYIYKTLYWREQSKNKQFINVLGTKGFHVTSKKFDWKKFKTNYRTLEINFGIGRYVCAIDNSEKSWLSKRDMLERAEALQLIKSSEVNEIAEL